MKRFAQIATVAGALSMLVGFVVYSQQKAGQPDGYVKIAPAGSATNAATRSAPPPAVAPGSKSFSPLVSPLAPTVASNRLHTFQKPPAGPATPVSDILASSSKSAIVIKPEDLAPGTPQVPIQLPATYTNPFAHYFAPPRQVSFSTKGGAIITQSAFPNQRPVAMATNPPPRNPAP